MLTRLVVIAGNGLSIAANEQFLLPKLTETLNDKLRDADRENLSSILAQQKSHLDQSLESSEDFEEIVGTMYLRSLDLRNLKDLFDRSFGDNDSRSKVIEAAEQITWKLSRDAVSALLEVLFEISESDDTNKYVIDEFVETIKSQWSTNVDFFTVNYDNLLAESMLRVYQTDHMHDLATSQARNIILSDSTHFRANVLRTHSSDFLGLSNRAGLFHLHGSLNFWRAGKEYLDFKVSKSALRDSKILLREVQNRNSFRPLVLLGKWESKWHAVKQAPFSLAYEMLERRLGTASHILIVGSSLREVAIFELIGEAINNAAEDGRDLNILVVGAETTSKDEFMEIIEKNIVLQSDSFGYKSIDSKAEGLRASPEWAEFSTSRNS